MFDFLKYYITSQNKHDIHSPFFYDLVTNGINDNGCIHPSFAGIEKIRKDLLNDKTKIKVSDYGTAFGGDKIYLREVSEITRWSAKPAKYSKLLYRLVKYFKPENMLEMGTSFGISAMYQAAANPGAKFISLEGCESSAGIAVKNFAQAGMNNIEIMQGNFAETLPEAIKKLDKLDYVFFDGNHQKKSTLDYFNQCIEKMNHGSVFIFDDISWSAGMEDAWNEIKDHEKTTATINLFAMGIVLFNPALSKQHFTIRF